MERRIKAQSKALKPSNTKNGAIDRNRVDGIEQASLPKTELPQSVGSLVLEEFMQSQSRSLFMGRDGKFSL